MKNKAFGMKIGELRKSKQLSSLHKLCIEKIRHVVKVQLHQLFILIHQTYSELKATQIIGRFGNLQIA